jgi:hypothetical protein
MPYFGSNDWSGIKDWLRPPSPSIPLLHALQMPRVTYSPAACTVVTSQRRLSSLVTPRSAAAAAARSSGSAHSQQRLSSLAAAAQLTRSSGSAHSCPTQQQPIQMSIHEFRKLIGASPPLPRPLLLLCPQLFGHCRKAHGSLLKGGRRLIQLLQLLAALRQLAPRLLGHLVDLRRPVIRETRHKWDDGAAEARQDGSGKQGVDRGARGSQTGSSFSEIWVRLACQISVCVWPVRDLYVFGPIAWIGNSARYGR